MDFLWGNPLSTAVGQRIVTATNPSLPSEDWALNMDICDLVNSCEEGPKDAVRAMRKRIVGNKSFKEVMLTLSVLETCVKNCGYRFHVLVTTRDFIEGVLVRTIIPSNNPPQIVHDRVLGIIQAWADAFRSSPDLTGVVSVYEDLRRKGLEFPVTELEGYGSKGKPPKQSENGLAVSSLPVAMLSSKPPLSPPHTSELKKVLEGTNAFSATQVRMLKAELGVVRSNLTTMSDMMTQLDPGTVQQADMELLQQLYSVCKEMQERIVKVVPRLNEEKLIEELLETNDQMNSTFSRYHRLERRFANGPDAAHKNHTYMNLTELDLTAESQESGLASCDSLSSQFNKLSTSESDETLSPRNINTSALQTPPSEKMEAVVDGRTSTQDNTIPVSQSSVMDDIEKWLELDDEFDDPDDSEGVTSEEFDRFLAERAKVAERLPSLRASPRETDHTES